MVAAVLASMGSTGKTVPRGQIQCKVSCPYAYLFAKVVCLFVWGYLFAKVGPTKEVSCLGRTTYLGRAHLLIIGIKLVRGFLKAF